MAAIIAGVLIGTPLRVRRVVVERNSFRFFGLAVQIRETEFIPFHIPSAARKGRGTETE
jgi:hypothetical protein